MLGGSRRDDDAQQLAALSLELKGLSHLGSVSQASVDHGSVELF